MPSIPTSTTTVTDWTGRFLPDGAGRVMDDFLSRALIAGIGFALVAGPLGCFVVWQRLAYFGDTMAHSALLGVALALAFQLNILLGVFGVCLGIALVLGRVSERSGLSGDTALGILSHSTLAVGLVLVSLMYWVRVDILHFLFGNILAVNWSEIIVLYAGGSLILAVLWWKWDALISLTVSEQIASAENMGPVRTRYLLVVLLAVIVAFAMKIVGIILTVALLIIPAAAARQFSAAPEQMAVGASIIGVLSVIGGLMGSLEFDTPPGPSIVVNALILFILGMIGSWLADRYGGRSGRSRPK